MKRKTVNSILKGVAGVGLTLGGVSALSDANLVFAAEAGAEAEQPELETPGGEQTQSNTVETLGEDVTSSGDASSVEGDIQTEDESSFEAERQKYLDSQPNATCTMNTVADAMIKAAEEANKSADAAAATDGEDQSVADAAATNGEKSEGEGGLERDDTTKTPEEGNKDQNQAGDNANLNGAGSAEANKTVDANKTADAKSKRIEELEGLIKEAQVNVDSEKAGKQKINSNYYRAADELVKLMIEYSALTEGKGFDGTIEFNNSYCSNKWVSNGIDHNNNFKQNYLEVTYTSGAMKDFVYYDYVNADKEGTILTGTTSESDASKIDHIVVYEKTPVFAVDDENGSFYFNKDGNFVGEDNSFTFVRDECRNIVAYIIDGQKIEVKVNENGERYIVDLENEDGSVVKTTVTGNNASGYTVTKTTFVTNEAGEKEQTSQSERLYKKLKGFSSGKKGKGEVYKKDLAPESGDDGNSDIPEEPVTPPVPETPQPETPQPETPQPETPQPETTETEIEDEDVPLADVPDVADEDIDTDDDLEEDLDEDVTDLEDEDVPLAVLDLDEPVDIPDADVPLSDNPETGDALTATWIGTAAASVAGLFGASRKKRKG